MDEPKDIMLSKVSQIEKDKSCVDYPHVESYKK